MLISELINSGTTPPNISANFCNLMQEHSYNDILNKINQEKEKMKSLKEDYRMMLATLKKK